MRLQASQSVDVAFNMAGIVGAQNHDHAAHTGPAFLGQRVARFDLAAQVYARLAELHATDEGLLRFGSAEISTLLRPNALFALRNEALGAALDQLIQQRRAAFRDRFKHRAAIQTLMSQTIPDLLTHLAGMRTSGEQRFQLLDAEYGAGSVVKTTVTRTTAPTTTSRTRVNPVSTVSAELDGSDVALQRPIQTEVFEVKNGGAQEDIVQRQKTPRTVGVPSVLSGGAWRAATTPFETQVVETTVAAAQEMTSELQAFSHPKLENAFGFHQTMAALLPEVLRHKTTELKLADIAEIMASELQILDLEVRTLQLNYVHSHLTAPIDGLITAVFKDVGESVEPGEPVLRIENDRVVLFVGRIQHQGRLSVGRNARLVLGSVFEDGSTQTIEGTIVAIRGHEADNDEWEIVIRTDNPIVDGSPLLPLQYSLDPDTDRLEPL
jgi:biotin carboxyl carrier protein